MVRPSLSRASIGALAARNCQIASFWPNLAASGAARGLPLWFVVGGVLAETSGHFCGIVVRLGRCVVQVSPAIVGSISQESKGGRGV